MGFNRRKMEDQRRSAAEKEAASRRATDAQVLEDAERRIDTTQRSNFIVNTKAGNPRRACHCHYVGCCFPRCCCFHSPTNRRAPDTLANKTGIKRGSLFHFVRVSRNDRLVRVQYLDRWQYYLAKFDRSSYRRRPIPFPKPEERLMNSTLLACEERGH